MAHTTIAEFIEANQRSIGYLMETEQFTFKDALAAVTAFRQLEALKQGLLDIEMELVTK